MLDFGCGAGRVLRHFLGRDDVELWGCDIDRASVSWLKEASHGRINALVVEEQPGLPVSEGHFDFIYAISVFTHLTQHWAGWMAELHRVLADDGLLYATFLGPDWVPRLTGEERWPEEQVGVVALGEGAPWDEGGPCTFVSEWWLRAHWGRAFDFVSLEPSHEPAQGVALMRKRSPRVEAEELERPAATDLEREARALVFAQKAMLRNAAQHRAMLEQRSATLEQRLIDVQTQIELVLQSKSWRLTAPLRALAARARR